MERLFNDRMSGQQKYDLIYSVLSEAYINDTLQPGNPCGCAVGNLVAKACGIKFYKNRWNKHLHWNVGSPKWPYKMVTFPRCDAFSGIDNPCIVRENQSYQQWFRTDLHPVLEELAIGELYMTGLPMDVLLNIEWRFENGAAKGASEDEKMFLGLNAVLDYLADEFGIKAKERRNKELEAVFQR